MEYSVQIEINKPKNEVANLFVNRETMPLWEEGLIQIEDQKQSLFETSSIGYLVFSFQNKETRMKVTVLDNQLPDSITIVYEVPGAYNQCINTFKERSNKTIWNMDVIFKFEEPLDIPLEAFINKTKKSMELFKIFVEKHHI